MRAWWGVLAALVACKQKATPPREAPGSARDAAVAGEAVAADAASSALPADFPARGARPLTGMLSGQSFAVAKANLRVTQGFAMLELYSWAEKEDPCAKQFAPDPDQLFISATFPDARLAAGAVIQAGDPQTIVVFKKPDFAPIDKAATIAIDEMTADRVTGRMTLTAPNDTRVAGTFTAALCTSPQRSLAAPAPIHGLPYGMSSVEPKALPKQPVSGVLLGTAGAPVAVEVVDWQSEYAAQHEVHFFFTQPKQDCAPDQISPGFKIGFGKTIAAGVTVKADVSTTTRTGQPFAVVLWQEPGNVLGMDGNGFVSAIIDRVTKDEVHGRVFAWFRDPSKSMVAGAFTAKRCKIEP